MRGRPREQAGKGSAWGGLLEVDHEPGVWFCKWDGAQEARGPQGPGVELELLLLLLLLLRDGDG